MFRSIMILKSLALALLMMPQGLALAAVYEGNPSNYRSLLDGLLPGDTLNLAAGTYTDGLPVYYLNGTPSEPIVIQGPAQGARAVFTGSNSSNTVRIRESSYIEIRNLELNGLGRAGDGVNADGGGDWAHHITIENFLIYGYDGDQSIVGISTNGCTTWNWIIRNNVIDGAGTGMYLGNSPGDNPFIGGLIENNLIRNTIGYNIEIKHQNPRPSYPGIPVTPSKTIIRHNVFTKGSNSSTGDRARPNLLVGHFPLSGPGQDDVYEIYGNVLVNNPTESLFQGEGNVAFYGNLLVNEFGNAVSIQAHNDVPREIRIFHNTIVAQNRGIRVSGADPTYEQIVAANAVFAGIPLSGGDQRDNVTDSYANAANYLTAPFGDIADGSLDLHPLPGTLTGAATDSSPFTQFSEYDRDFNGAMYDWTFRGGYSSEGANPGWPLALERKPTGGDGTDWMAPAAPTGLQAN